MKQVIECITKNYFNFSGRANRKEYWQFYFMTLIISLVLANLDQFYFKSLFDEGGMLLKIPSILLNFTLLFLIIPSLAVGCRRLHDTNRRGTHLLLSLIPAIGTIWLIVLLCKKGDKESNTYGQPPMDYVRNPSRVA